MPTSLPIALHAPPVPIVCTLGAGEYAQRLAWIAALNRAALRAHRRHGLALVLDYAPGAAAQVRELVAREQTCCAFLTFRVEEARAAVRLTVAASADARDSLDALFAPFLGGAPGTASTTDRNEPPAAGSDGGRAPGIAAGMAAAALACGVCCVVPFALLAVALATFGGLFAAVAGVYWWALGVAVVPVVAAQGGSPGGAGARAAGQPSPRSGRWSPPHCSSWRR